MVLGPSAKNKKGGSVQVDYLIHIQEVKPWPPSQSLRSLRSVLIQWENGDRNSGTTEMVVPSLGSVIGEGKIEFNESFRLRTTLLRVAKGKDTDAFQKNCLEFNLCESRRDNKTQLLATAIIDLADYGVVSEQISLTAPMNSKRSFRNTSEPILHISIQPVDKHNRSSLRDSMSKEELVEKNHGGSVSALMNDEYAEEAEVASFTDDDISSHSSLTNGGSVPQNEQTGPDRLTDSKRRLNGDHNVTSKFENDKHTQQQDLKGSSSCSSSVDLSSELESSVNGHASIMNSIDSSTMSSVDIYANKAEEGNMAIGRNGHQDSSEKIDEKIDAHPNGKTNTSYLILPEEASSPDDDDIDDASAEDMDGKMPRDNGSPRMEDKKYSLEDQSLDTSQVTRRNCGSSESYTPSSDEIYRSDRLRHVKSVRSPSDSVRSNGMIGRNNHNDVKEISSIGETQNSSGNLKFNETKCAKIFPKDIRSTISDSKIQQLELKIKMLEGELREAAAIEASLYSIVAEHGSSVSKVHAPARRLSRLYLHACKDKIQSRRANAARTSVSGLVLVAKACGNDVPRLTFWLSNCVVLRAIISQTTKGLETQYSAGSRSERNGPAIDYKTTSSLKWKESSGLRKDKKNLLSKDCGNWESIHTYISALERVEAWIFSRIVESIWWQTLTPHMQSAATKDIDKVIGFTSRTNLKRTSSSSDPDQGNFSINLWKEAFKDASERLCPVRAGGHECGCLPELARLVMEQCVARLDVAMFNAILRESEDEMPTDPASDPISDLRVLPIPAGKSSFGAGAQLKNAIGNWSRWLTDLFGMDDDDALEDEDDDRQDESFKSFHLLLALSDLMMLPKDMLLSKSIRKEVCPIFGAPLIKRVLDYFTPDEFCPDPIPDVVLDALESEAAFEDGEDSVAAVPCIAAPPIYLPPSVDAIASTSGEFAGQPELRRSGSSVLRKSYTSDDELDELTSPLASIILKSSHSSPGQMRANWKRRDESNRNAIRYELLRDVWLNSE